MVIYFSWQVIFVFKWHWGDLAKQGNEYHFSNHSFIYISIGVFKVAGYTWSFTENRKIETQPLCNTFSYYLACQGFLLPHNWSLKIKNPTNSSALIADSPSLNCFLTKQWLQTLCIWFQALKYNYMGLIAWWSPQFVPRNTPLLINANRCAPTVLGGCAVHFILCWVAMHICLRSGSSARAAN